MNRKNFLQSLFAVAVIVVSNPLKLFAEKRYDFVWNKEKTGVILKEVDDGRFVIATDPHNYIMVDDLKLPDWVKYIRITTTNNLSQ